MTDSQREALRKIQSEARAEHIPVMRERTAELLESLIKENKPSEILEIGTSVGTSGIIALLSGGGRLTTVELDGGVLERARENFRAFGLTGRTTFIEGDCERELQYLSGNIYDCILLDGPKSRYGVLYEMLLPMLRTGGILFVDDIAYHGKVAGGDYPAHKHRTIVRAMRVFLDTVQADTRVRAEFFQTEDGIAVIRKL